MANNQVYLNGATPNFDGTSGVVNPTIAWDVFDTVVGGVANGVTMNGLGGTIYAYGGTDSLFGNSGVDNIYGGDGNDIIASSVSGAGAFANFSGAGGNDFYYGEAGNDSIYIDGAGNKTAYGDDVAGAVTAGNDQIFVGFTRTVTAGNNVVYAGGGDDNVVEFAAATGANYYSLGAGTDAIALYGSGADTIYAGAGVDSVFLAGNAVYTVYGEAGTDSIIIGATNSKANYISGGAGNDSLTVLGTGANSLYGGDGADTIEIYGSGANTIYGETGGDSITVFGSGANVIYGGAGDESILLGTGATGNNIIYGGTGNDSIDVTGSGLAVAGSTTIHYITGDQADSIGGFSWGSATGADNITFDSLTGAALAAEQISFAGTQMTIVLGTNGDSLTIDGATATTMANGTYTTNNFVTSDGAKIVFANAGTQTLSSANAYVRGLATGAGSMNQLTYDATALKYIGNSSSNDIVSAAALGTAVTIDLNDSTKYSSIETAVGGTGADILRGKLTGADTLRGGAGNDLIWGRGGNDSLDGGTGADTYYIGLADENDSLAGSTAGNIKTVDLYDVALSQITVTSEGGVGGNTRLSFAGSSADVIGGEVASAAGLGNTYAVADTKFILGNDQVMKVAGVGVAGADNVISYDSTVNIYNASAALGRVILNAGSSASAVTIDLRDTTAYRGIHDVYGSSTVGSILRGTVSGADTLTGGTGADQIWGAGGADSIDVGIDAVSDTVYFGKTDGNDTLINQTSADKVKLWNVATSDISGFSQTAGNLILTLNTGNDALTITNGTTSTPSFILGDGSTFTVGIASAGNATYAATNLFYAGTGAGIINASADTAGVLVDLSNTAKFGTYIAATSGFNGVTGGAGSDTLRGGANVADNIIGGAGNDYIWGNSGADNLTGGAGVDTFYWGSSDANDTILDGVSGERVMLYSNGMVASNVTASVAGTVLTLTSAAGNTLTINGWSEASGLNKFVFGYSETSDNCYKVTSSGGTYSLVKIS